MSSAPAPTMDWQRLIAAIIQNLPCILALIQALIDAIVSDTATLPDDLKRTLVKLKHAIPTSWQSL